MHINYRLRDILFLGHSKKCAVHLLKILHRFGGTIGSHYHLDSVWEVAGKPECHINFFGGPLRLLDKVIDSFEYQDYFIVNSLMINRGRLVQLESY